MSNGTEELVFLDPAKLVKKRSLQVLDRGRPLRSLNELEYIKGEIFANIWHEDLVARISPKTGEVTGWIDMSDLRKELPPGSNADVLNGIAFDAQNRQDFRYRQALASSFRSRNNRIPIVSAVSDPGSLTPWRSGFQRPDGRKRGQEPLVS